MDKSASKPGSIIALPGIAGKLVLAPCPGSWRGRPLPGADPVLALAQDLDHLARLGAGGLLSLVEAHELPCEQKLFSVAVRETGLEWAHAAIPDYSAPTAAFAEDWQKLALLRRLAAGENWAIHCKAGLGRTGTVAALLLIECGLEAEAAIAKIRHEHAAGAIETPAQVEYLIAHARSRM
ncbi:protein-tyrosine phosphatase family protein [Bosea sp. 2YAB26]|uniref:phosphatase domain-containing protein n=1 Tax=Bosea sp. 2YAB26 TaxID=3237478 RepID=UPI003F8FC80D